MAGLTSEDVIKFWGKVAMSPTCWVWTGGLSGRNHPRGGYGNFYAAGKSHRAHRVSYELEVGSIPKDLVLDHICRNRACVNPLHLEPVTNKENVRRGNSMNRNTHCRRGHKYDGLVRSRKNRPPEQRCTQCEKIREQRFKEK